MKQRKCVKRRTEDADKGPVTGISVATCKPLIILFSPGNFKGPLCPWSPAHGPAWTTSTWHKNLEAEKWCSLHLVVCRIRDRDLLDEASTVGMNDFPQTQTKLFSQRPVNRVDSNTKYLHIILLDTALPHSVSLCWNHCYLSCVCCHSAQGSWKIRCSVFFSPEFRYTELQSSHNSPPQIS